MKASALSRIITGEWRITLSAIAKLECALGMRFDTDYRHETKCSKERQTERAVSGAKSPSFRVGLPQTARALWNRRAEHPVVAPVHEPVAERVAEDALSGAPVIRPHVGESEIVRDVENLELHRRGAPEVADAPHLDDARARLDVVLTSGHAGRRSCCDGA